MNKILFNIVSIFILTVILLGLYSIWKPGALVKMKCSAENNGLWAGTQWFTGINVKTGKCVNNIECKEFIRLLRDNKIKYVFINAGRVTCQGTIKEKPGNLWKRLKSDSPEFIYLPWISGNVANMDINNRNWRKLLVKTIRELQDEGFQGVHLDIEPLKDWEPGYIELLQEIRRATGKKFFLSQASRRLSPGDINFKQIKNHFWSSSFYMATMHDCDQTVLMGYDTSIRLQKVYIAYIAYQTRKLMDLSSRVSGHELLIGIPSYENLSEHSDSRVENIKNALTGIGAALRELGENGKLSGVAVFAHWLTDTYEWEQYRKYWLVPAG